MSLDEQELPALVDRWRSGDEGALDDLVAFLYDDLRALAHRHLEQQREGHTLDTTALVHEVYLKLTRRAEVHWQGRPQLLALMSRIMRNVLVDHARRHRAEKRTGDRIRVPLDESMAGEEAQLMEVLYIHDALERLEARDERLARIVEYRFFGGMKMEEIATALEVSTRTVQRGWSLARAFLYVALETAPDEG